MSTVIGSSRFRRRPIAAALVAAGLLAVAAASAQPQQAAAAPVPREFEVLSIKKASFPNESYFAGFTARGTCNKGRITISGNRLELPAISLCGLIRLAYNLQDYQIDGLPKELTKADQANFYTLEARGAGADTLTDEQVRQMLQPVLADRFQLKFHRETREMPVLELTVAKGGLKVSATPPAACSKGAYSMTFGRLRRGMTDCAGNTTIAMLAERLSPDADRPIFDRTGFTGKFAFDLQWAPEEAAHSDSTLPGLFTAVQEQLGLKLEPKKAPASLLVIDRAERASDN